MKFAANSRLLKWTGRVLLAGFVVVIFAFVLTRPRMPSYQGRSAESWLRDVFGTYRNSQSQRTSFDAFGHMGTNGINFLVEALDRKQGTTNQIYVRVFNSLPLVLKRLLPEPVAADTLANAASLVMMNIHDESPKQTFSRLVHLLEADNPRTRLHAANVIAQYVTRYWELDLSNFQSEVVCALRDTNYWIRFDLGFALLTQGREFTELSDAIMPALTNADPVIQNAAQTLLNQMAKTNVSASIHAP